MKRRFWYFVTVIRKLFLTGMALLLLLCTACGKQTETEENANVVSGYGDDESAESESDPADSTEPSPKEDEVPLTVGETFRAVLLSERPFFYLFNYVPYADVMQESYVYLNEVIFNDAPLVTPRFAIVDMDGDQVPEVVLEIDDYMGYIILRYKDGEIYGNEIGYRSLESLKEDGSHGVMRVPVIIGSRSCTLSEILLFQMIKRI